MDDFFDSTVPLDDENKSLLGPRLDAEWTTLNAIREMLGIGLKGRLKPTYDQALSLGKTLAPQLFDSQDSVLGRDIEPPLAQEYRQRAEALSEIRGRIVEPLEILDEAIAEHNRLIMTGGDRSRLQRRLNDLQSIRPLFMPKQYTENQIILRDLFKAERELPNPPIEGDRYREFKLPNDRGIRIRLLHPDPPEHSIGADLIYEHYWGRKRLVRIAIIQYKIWNGKTLYFSQSSSIKDQMDKLRGCLTNNAWVGIIGVCQRLPIHRHDERDAIRPI